MTDQPTEQATDKVTERLANFVSRTQYADLPADVVHETKRILLDVLGCALGSVNLPKSTISIEVAREFGGRPEATILGSREKTSAPLAAFANGELMNALDYCAVLPPNHITAFVVPAVMAVAEAKKASGRDLLAGVALAHEVASRVGLSLDSLRGGKEGEVAETWGLGFTVFGSAAGAAKILGLEGNAMLDALGLAGYFAPVPSHNSFLLTKKGGGLAKYGPAGWSAQGGVTTAMLASKGYAGDRVILDSHVGFAAMTGSQSFKPEKITDGLGELWNLKRVTYKCWPCCGLFQGPLGAFSKLVADHDLGPEEIESVLVRNESMTLVPRFRDNGIDHHVDMQFSIHYNLAMAAHRVPVGAGWQDERWLNHAGVRALMKKIVIEPFADAAAMRHQELVVGGKAYIERRPTWVQVKARGTTFTQTADYAKWLSTDNPEYRATDEDLAQKFRANSTATVGDAKVEQAIERIMNLERVEDLGELIDVLAR
jgi:2-methylcitrate dehydratase PrpD